MNSLLKERFLAKNTKRTYLKILIHHDNRDWIAPRLSRAMKEQHFSRKPNHKSLADAFFPRSLGFTHMLSNMSQAALAM